MTSRRCLLIAAATALALALPATVPGGQARAQGAGSDAAERLFARENDITARLRALSQAMAKEMAEVAAGNNADRALADLGRERQQFGALVGELRALDRAPESKSSSNPEIGRLLAETEAAWPDFDRIIGDAVTWEHLTHYEVLQFDSAARRLGETLQQLQGAYRRSAADFGVHSVVLNAIAIAEEQRVLSQEIPRAFVMMLYGVNAPENRQRLAVAIDDFDRDLRGLVQGDPERGLVPPPTPQIRSDLTAAQSTWTELRGVLTLESAGVVLDSQAIADVSELSDVLYRQLDAAIGGLRAL